MSNRPIQHYFCHISYACSGPFPFYCGKNRIFKTMRSSLESRPLELIAQVQSDVDEEGSVRGWGVGRTVWVWEQNSNPNVIQVRD